jgi:hypothetical protein
LVSNTKNSRILLTQKKQKEKKCSIGRSFLKIRKFQHFGKKFFSIEFEMLFLRSLFPFASFFLLLLIKILHKTYLNLFIFIYCHYSYFTHLIFSSSFILCKARLFVPVVNQKKSSLSSVKQQRNKKNAH